ncbi:MAG: hypothetical protein ACI8RD_011646, partial [Bacillariaceae sp.]
NIDVGVENFKQAILKTNIYSIIYNSNSSIDDIMNINQRCIITDGKIGEDIAGWRIVRF